MPESPHAMTRWSRAYPLAFGAGMFVVMGFLGLLVFWDYRGALAGAICSAGFSYMWVRPGGIGYRVEAHEQRVLAERGDNGVRLGWLVKALAVVLAALALAVAVGYLVA